MNQRKPILSLYLVAIFLALSLSGFGQEVWVNPQTGDDFNPGTLEEPYFSLHAAIGGLEGGGVVHASGLFTGKWRLKDLKYTHEDPLIIAGKGAVIWGFKLPPPFDPSTHIERTLDSCISIQDSEHIIIRDVECQGGGGQGIELNNSYPWVDSEGNARGLGWITLDGITVRNCKANGIFSGGHVIHDLTIKDCKILDTVVPPGQGGTNHGIYISGGNWKPEWPPYWGIKILRTEVTRTGGRHCIQFNCRARGVTIRGCLLRHAQLCGLSAIGVQDLVFENNIVYGGNKQCVVIFDDEWGANLDDKNTRDAFLSTHQPNKNHYYKNNTFVCGPKQWMKDPWHNNNPMQQPVFLINNDVHWRVEKYGEDYRNENFYFEGNIFVGTNGEIISCYHDYETAELQLVNNMIWVLNGEDPYLGAAGTPKFMKGNILKNPRFQEGPLYPNSIDLGKDPFYDWTQHPTKFNAYSIPGKKTGMGKQFKVAMISKKVDAKVPIIDKIIPGPGIRKLDKLPEIFERLKESGGDGGGDK